MKVFSNWHFISQAHICLFTQFYLLLPLPFDMVQCNCMWWFLFYSIVNTVHRSRVQLDEIFRMVEGVWVCVLGACKYVLVICLQFAYRANYIWLIDCSVEKCLNLTIVTLLNRRVYFKEMQMILMIYIHIKSIESIAKREKEIPTMNGISHDFSDGLTE